MKPLLAFIKKEYLEAARTGKITILALLFVLFGILNRYIGRGRLDFHRYSSGRTDLMDTVFQKPSCGTYRLCTDFQ